MKRIVKIGYALLAGIMFPLCVTSCGSDEPLEEFKNQGNQKDEPFEYTVIKFTDSQELVAQKVPEFSQRIFKALNKAYSTENVVFSPLSCQWCMGMLSSACQGKGRDQIMEVMGYQDFSLEQINDFNGLLTREIKARDNTITVETANGMFQIPEIAPYVRADYKGLLSDFYSADIISSKNLPKSINEWVKSKTHGMIPKLYDEKSSNLDDAIIGLVNALYFKGQWRIPFDKKDSYVDKFNLPNGKMMDVEYMSMHNLKVSVFNHQGAKSIDLPFGNGSFYLEVILPDEGVEINDLVENLDFSKKEYLSYNDLEFSLPKFTLNTLFKLNDVLQSLGMVDVFKMGCADFSPMLENTDTSKMFLGDIRQGCGFSIDEKGATVASATSGVVMDGCSWEVSPKMVFKVNRPFLFVLKEFSTGSILLMGKVSLPVQTKK